MNPLISWQVAEAVAREARRAERDARTVRLWRPSRQPRTRR
jgi:hypothetical protein